MKDYCMVIMPTHNSAAKPQRGLFSTSTYMIIYRRKTLPTMEKLLKWENPHLKEQ